MPRKEVVADWLKRKETAERKNRNTHPEWERFTVHLQKTFGRVSALSGHGRIFQRALA
jgi:hypothetical protein